MYRHATPPSVMYAYAPSSAHSRNTSDGSHYSSDYSPESAMTANTSPPRSPVRQHGVQLLPKVRQQDQVTEPAAAPGPIRHRKTASASSLSFMHMSPYGVRASSMHMRAASPPEHSTLVSPISQASPYEEASFSNLNSPITFGPAITRNVTAGHSRSHSAAAPPRLHQRSSSTTSIDQSVLARYGYPTYRTTPSYSTVPRASSASATPPPVLSVNTGMSNVYTADVDYAPYPTDFQVSDFDSAPAVQAVQYPAAAINTYDVYQTTPTTSMLEYLTLPNPSPNLVRRTTTARTGNNYFWWDVRNLRQWEDFSMEEISQVPGLMQLLQIPVPTANLPTPPRPNLQPETESQLHEIARDFHLQKVNAALKVSLGEPAMSIRAYKPGPGSQHPDFVANYPFDYEKNLLGDVRGRVVGLVKSYNQWNTGMRSEPAHKQIEYLRGLAHLQKVMRDHGCRYGFIMTEIELLCVRAGGPPDAGVRDPTIVNNTGSIPLFGYLELSGPIPLNTNGFNLETGAAQMSAGLALWYLHMLAKANPLEGAVSWRMDVGGPSALTRQNVVEKDKWIPGPNLSEKREAKRVRGWIMPEEPYNKKESGKTRKPRRS